MTKRPERSTTGQAQSRHLRFWARLVLAPVAIIGAVLSFHSLHDAALPTFGPGYAAGFPLLVDLLILGASLQYVAGTKVRRSVRGWRLTAHAGVIATLGLNALAAEHVSQVPWHVTAPAVWAVLVELTAQQARGDTKTTDTPHHNGNAISWILWLTAPLESTRTRLLMMRTGITDAHTARIAVGVHAAAREVLRLALPHRNGHRVRKIISRQLRAGSLPPAAILVPLGWGEPHRTMRDRRPETVLQAVLYGVLDPAIQATAPGQRTQSFDAGPVSAAADDTFTDDPPDQDRPADPDDHDLAGDDVSEGIDNGSHEKKGPDTGPATDMDEDDSADTTKQDAHSRDPSGNPRSEQHQRLAAAVNIMRQTPNITGPALRAALSAQGWDVSVRTATRILPTARREAATEPRVSIDSVRSPRR